MKTSPQGVAEISGHEGIVLSPYKDSVGVWTVFVGHTAAAGAPDPQALPRGVEQPIAAALDTFRRDLADVEARVAKAISVPLQQHEFDALVSFDFNTGGIFRARITKLLNAGDRAGAAAAFDGWRKPPEIAGRREAEKRLFRDRVYSHGGKASLYPADVLGNIQWSRGRRVDVLALMAAPAAAPSSAAPRPADGATPAAPPAPVTTPAGDRPAGNSDPRPPAPIPIPAPARTPPIAGATPTRTPPPIVTAPQQRQPDDPGIDLNPGAATGGGAAALVLPILVAAAGIGALFALLRRGIRAAARTIAAAFRRVL